MSEEVSWQELMGIDNSPEDSSLSPVFQKNKWTVHRKTNKENISENAYPDNGESSAPSDDRKENNQINSVSVTEKEENNKSKSSRSCDEEIVYYSPIKARSAKRKIFDHPLSGSISPHKPLKKKSRTKIKPISKETLKQIASSSSKIKELKLKSECDTNIEIPQSSNNNFSSTPVSHFSTNIKRKLIYSTNKLRSKSLSNNLNINDFYKSVITMEEADKVPSLNKCKSITPLTTDNFVKFSSLLKNTDNLNGEENDCKMSDNFQVEEKLVNDISCKNYVLNDSLNNFQFTEVEKHYHSLEVNVQKQDEPIDDLPKSENLNHDKIFNDLENIPKNNPQTSEFNINKDEQSKMNSKLKNTSLSADCSFSSPHRNELSKFNQQNDNSVQYDDILSPLNTINCEAPEINTSLSEDIFKCDENIPCREYSKSNKEEKHNSILMESNSEINNSLSDNINTSFLQKNNDEQDCVSPNLDGDSFRQPRIQDEIIRSSSVCLNDLNISCMDESAHFHDICTRGDKESTDFTESTNSSKAKVEALLQGILDKPSDTPIQRLLSEEFSDLNSTLVQFSTANGSIVTTSQDSLDKAKVLMQDELIKGKVVPQHSLELPKENYHDYLKETLFKDNLIDNENDMKPFLAINENEQSSDILFYNLSDTTDFLGTKLDTVVEKSVNKISNEMQSPFSSTADISLKQKSTSPLKNYDSINNVEESKECPESISMNSLQEDKGVSTLAIMSSKYDCENLINVGMKQNISIEQLVKNVEISLLSSKTESNDDANASENSPAAEYSLKVGLHQLPANDNNSNENYMERKSEFLSAGCSYKNDNDFKREEPFHFSTAGGSVVPVSEECLRQVRAEAQMNYNNIDLAHVSTEETNINSIKFLNDSVSSNSSATSSVKHSLEDQPSSGSKFFGELEFSTEDLFSKEYKVKQNSKQNLNTSLSESFLIDPVNKTPITKTPFKSWKLTSSKKLLSLSTRSRRLSLSNSSSENSTPKNVTRKNKISEEGWKSQFFHEIKRAKYEEEADRIVKSPEYDLRSQHQPLTKENDNSITNENLPHDSQTQEVDSSIKSQKTQFIFKTAKGKKVNIKKESLRKAKNKLKDELKPDIYQIEAEYIIKSPEYDLKNQTVSTVKKDLKNENVAQSTGCNINITKQSLRNIKKKLKVELEPVLYENKSEYIVKSPEYDLQIKRSSLDKKNHTLISVNSLSNDESNDEGNISKSDDLKPIDDSAFTSMMANGEETIITNDRLKKIKSHLNDDLKYTVDFESTNLDILKSVKFIAASGKDLNISNKTLKKAINIFKHEIDLCAEEESTFLNEPVFLGFSDEEIKVSLILENTENIDPSEYNKDNNFTLGESSKTATDDISKDMSVLKDKSDIKGPKEGVAEVILDLGETNKDIPCSSNDSKSSFVTIVETAAEEAESESNKHLYFENGITKILLEEILIKSSDEIPKNQNSLVFLTANENEVITSQKSVHLSNNYFDTNNLSMSGFTSEQQVCEFPLTETERIIYSNTDVSGKVQDQIDLENPIVLSNNDNEILQKVENLEEFRDIHNESKVHKLSIKEENGKFSLRSVNEQNSKENEFVIENEYSGKSNSRIEHILSNEQPPMCAISENSFKNIKNLYNEVDASSTDIHKLLSKQEEVKLSLREVEKCNSEENLLNAAHEEFEKSSVLNEYKDNITEKSAQIVKNNFKDTVLTHIKKSSDQEEVKISLSPVKNRTEKNTIKSTLKVENATSAEEHRNSTEYIVKSVGEVSNQSIPMFSNGGGNNNVIFDNSLQKVKNQFDEWDACTSNNIQKSSPRQEEFKIPNLPLNDCKESKFPSATVIGNSREGLTSLNDKNKVLGELNYCSEYAVKFPKHELLNQPMPMFSTARGNKGVISENSLQKIMNLFDELDASSSKDIQKSPSKNKESNFPSTTADRNSSEESMSNIDHREIKNFTETFTKSGNNLSNQVCPLLSKFEPRNDFLKIKIDANSSSDVKSSSKQENEQFLMGAMQENTTQENLLNMDHEAFEKVENLTECFMSTPENNSTNQVPSMVSTVIQNSPVIDPKVTHTFPSKKEGFKLLLAPVNEHKKLPSSSVNENRELPSAPLNEHRELPSVPVNEHRELPSAPVNDQREFNNQAALMFSTARGNKISVSGKSLEKIKNLFKDEFEASCSAEMLEYPLMSKDDKYPSTSGESNTKDCSLNIGCAISTIKKIAIEDEIINTPTPSYSQSTMKSCENKLANTLPPMFTTGTGKNIVISEKSIQKINNTLKNEFDSNSSSDNKRSPSKQEENKYPLSTVQDSNTQENLLNIDHEAFENFTQHFMGSVRKSINQEPSMISTAIENTPPKEIIQKINNQFKHEFDASISKVTHKFSPNEEGFKLPSAPVNEHRELNNYAEVLKSQYDSSNQAAPMFSTARGNKISISGKSLEKIKNLFKDEFEASCSAEVLECPFMSKDDKYPSTSEESNTKECSLNIGCAISTKKQIMIEDETINTPQSTMKSCDNKLANNLPPMFVTGTGENMVISEKSIQKINNTLKNEFDSNSSSGNIRSPSKQEEDKYPLSTVQDSNTQENLLNIDHEAFENFTQHFMGSVRKSINQEPSMISTAIENTPPKEIIQKINNQFKNEFDASISKVTHKFSPNEEGFKLPSAPVNEHRELNNYAEVLKSQYGSSNQAAPMFSTARGNKISISGKSLEKIKNLFKDEFEASCSEEILEYPLMFKDDKYPSTSGESNTKECSLNIGCAISTKKHIMIEDEIINTPQSTMKSCDNKLANNPPPMFATGTGKKIVISEKGIQKINNTLKNEFDSNSSSDVKRSSKQEEDKFPLITVQESNTQENLLNIDHEAFENFTEHFMSSERKSTNQEPSMIPIAKENTPKKNIQKTNNLFKNEFDVKLQSTPVNDHRELKNCADVLISEYDSSNQAAPMFSTARGNKISISAKSLEKIKNLFKDEFEASSSTEILEYPSTSGECKTKESSFNVGCAISTTKQIKIEDKIKDEIISKSSQRYSLSTMKSFEKKLANNLPPILSTDTGKNSVISENNLHKVMNLFKGEFDPGTCSKGLASFLEEKTNKNIASTSDMINSKEILSKNKYFVENNQNENIVECPKSLPLSCDLIKQIPVSLNNEQKGIDKDTFQKINNTHEFGVGSNTKEGWVETKVTLPVLKDLEEKRLSDGEHSSNYQNTNFVMKTSDKNLTNQLLSLPSNTKDINVLIPENIIQKANNLLKDEFDAKINTNEIKSLEAGDEKELGEKRTQNNSKDILFNNENNIEITKYEGSVENTMKHPQYNLTSQSSSISKGNKVVISEKNLNLVKNIIKEDFDTSCSTKKNSFNFDIGTQNHLIPVEENIGTEFKEILENQSNFESSLPNSVQDLKFPEVRNQNCVLLIADGKNIDSGKNLHMTKDDLIDSSSQISDPILMPEPHHSVPTSNKGESSVQSTDKSVEFIRNTDQEIQNIDQSCTPTKLPFMFSTAKGSSVAISMESLLKVRNLMEDNLPETIGNQSKQDNTIDITMPIRKDINAVCDGIVKNNKSSQKSPFTFSTATGNSVMISEQSLKKVRSQSSVLTDSKIISSVDSVSVSDVKLYKGQNLVEVSNNIQPEDTPKTHLPTVLNSKVGISEEDIKNVNNPFKDEVVIFNQPTGVKGNSNYLFKKNMFSSASGSSVIVSEECLNLVRNKFEQGSEVCNFKKKTEIVASGNNVNYLEGSLKKVLNAHSDIKFNAHENLELSSNQENVRGKSFIFSTVQGNIVCESEMSLDRVEAQFNKDSVVVAHSKVEYFSDNVATIHTPKSISENEASQEKHDGLVFTPTMSGKFLDDELNRIEQLVSQNKNTGNNSPKTKLCASKERQLCDTPVTYRSTTKLHSNGVANVPQRRRLLYKSQEASNSAASTTLEPVIEKPYVTSPSRISDRSHLMPAVSCEIEFGSDDDIFASAESQTKAKPNDFNYNNNSSEIHESGSLTEKRKSDTELTTEPISKKVKLSNEFQVIDMDGILHERGVRREEQKQKIISKTKNHPTVSQGLYMDIRNKDSLLKFMEDPLNNPSTYSYEELLELGLCSDVINITSKNAVEFQFDGHYFFNEECFSKSGFIDLGSGFNLILSDNNKIGLKELSSSFLASPNVDPSLVPEGWIKNHYRWIVWKLSSLEKSFPHILSKRYLIPLNVLHQLKYRYDREIYLVQRPAFRRILECDEPSSRRFIARVSDCRKVESDELDPAVELELTDGWYGVWTTVDSAMKNLVTKGTVKVGTKLVIQGAELLNCGDGCDPLELKESIRLKLNSNSVRRAKWHARMGFTQYPGPLHISLNSILPNGGLVGVTSAIICRVYPLLYMSKDSNGKSVVRNSQAENQIAATFEKERNLKSEELYEQILTEVENKFKKGPKIKLDLKNLNRIMNPPALYRIVSQEPEIHASLSPEQLDLVKKYHEEIKSKIQVEVQNTLQEKLKEFAPQRQVTNLLKVRIVDPSTECTALVTVWRPSEDLCSLLTENRCVDFHALTASGIRDKILQLSSNKLTHYKESSKFPKSPKYQRKLTELSELVSQKSYPQFCELDVVGVVIYVKESEKPGGITNVYLSDLKDNFLMITFWTSLKAFGYADVLKQGSIVSAINLHWRQGSGSYVVPSTFANELTYFSSHPSQGYILKGINDLKTYFSEEDLHSFVSSRKETLLSLLKERSSNNSTTPTRRVESIGLSPHVAKRLEKLKNYGAAPPLPKISLHSSPDIRKSFKPPKINKTSTNSTSV